MSTISAPSPTPASAHAPKTLLLVGGTGLVGLACLRLLARDPRVGEVRLLVRRPSGIATAGLPGGSRIVEHLVDFERLDMLSVPRSDAAQSVPQSASQSASQSSLFAVDAVICALGTTIATAGSQAAFRRVDCEYPLRIARLARQHGAAHFAVVTAIGADPHARTFYSRTKGELEAALKALDYPALTIVRPSFLLGERAERRPLESVARRVGLYLPAKWRSIPVERVARALVAGVLADDARGVQVIENDALHRGPPMCR